MSERLDRLIQDEVQRTYLETDDGYWADLVLSEFGFLEEREGRLDSIAFHQKGDYIRYSGRWGTVVLEFMPDNYPEGRWIEASAHLRGAARTFEGSLDSLIGETKWDPPRPTLAPVDRETIRANVHAWAEALRSAVDLF